MLTTYIFVNITYTLGILQHINKINYAYNMLTHDSA